MRWIRMTAAEAYGLFVDDGSFALSIIIWLAVMSVLSVHLPHGGGWSGVVLFAGLVVILFWSTMSRSRQ